MNNAGNFYAGYFEEISAGSGRKWRRTGRPAERDPRHPSGHASTAQRSGDHVTSTAGLIGQEFVVAYAASKFALEGWMESLRFDVAPYGIRTMSVEPGSSTELLVEGASTIWPELSIELCRPHGADDRSLEGHERPAGR